MEGTEGDSMEGADPQAWLQRFRAAKAGTRRRPAAAGGPSSVARQQSGASLGGGAAGRDGAGSPAHQPEG